MLAYLQTVLSVRKAVLRGERFLARLQERRFRRMLHHAVKHSRFYRDLYRGIDLGRCQIQDLPIVTKAQLMDRFDDVVTDPRITAENLGQFLDDPRNLGRRYLGRYAVAHTSGSQGQPMLLVHEPRAIELLFALQMTRGNATSQVGPIEVLRRLREPRRLAVVTLKRGFYPSASMFEYMPEVAKRLLQVERFSQTDPDLNAKLEAYRPQILTGYATVLDTLAIEVQAGRLNLKGDLIQLVNNSEALTDAARSRIEAAFGLHVIDNYATGECPHLTNGCLSGSGAYVNRDWAILENVDADGRGVPENQAGARVLVTNLANRVLPILRYEVGDAIVMGSPDPGCPRPLPRVLRVEGRSADCFWIADRGGRPRKVINLLFKNTMDHARTIREWRAIQVERNRIVVQLEVLPNQRFDEPRFRQIFDHQMDLYGYRGLMDVSFEVVAKLESDPETGKYRRIVSLVGPPETVQPASKQVRLHPAHTSLPDPKSLAGQASISVQMDR